MDYQAAKLAVTLTGHEWDQIVYILRLKAKRSPHHPYGYDSELDDIASRVQQGLADAIAADKWVDGPKSEYDEYGHSYDY